MTVSRAIIAHLEREGLVLCRAPDTSFALDAERLESVAEDLGAAALAAEWDDSPTTEATEPVMLRLRRASVASDAHPRLVPA